MSDLERRLESTLKVMGDAHVENLGAEVPRLRSEVLGRARRKKAFNAIVLAAAAAAMVALAVLAWPESALDRAEPAPPAGDEPGRAVTEEIVLGNIEGLAQHIAATDAGIYVAGNDYLHRIDPATNKVETLYEHPRYESGQEHCCMDLSGLGDDLLRIVTIGEGNPSPILQRVSLQTGESEQSQAASVGAGEDPDEPVLRSVEVGDNWAWTYGLSLRPEDRMVQMVDPDTIETEDAYPLDEYPLEAAAFGDQLWMVVGTHSDRGDTSLGLVRVTPGQGISAESATDLECLTDLAVDAEGVWVIDQCDQSLTWFDPVTLEQIAETALPSHGGTVATGLGSVWVTLETNKVARFVAARSDGEASIQLIEQVDVGKGPFEIVESAGAMWVTTLGSSVTKITLEHGTAEPTVAPSESESEPEPVETEDASAETDRANFAAIWPASNFDDAVEACEHPAPWLQDDAPLPHEFVFNLLGWEGTTSTHRPDLSTEFYETWQVLDPENELNAVLVRVFEFEEDCWMVSGVLMPEDYQDQDAEGSISVRGRELQLGWPRYRGTGFVIAVEYQEGNGVLADTADTSIELRLPERPTTTGFVLILYKDDQNRTIGARSITLPAGDFAAG